MDFKIMFFIRKLWLCDDLRGAMPCPACVSSKLNQSRIFSQHVARSAVRGKVIYKVDPSISEGGKVIKPIIKWMAPLLSNPQVR
jgi:hypothetical protein